MRYIDLPGEIQLRYQVAGIALIDIREVYWCILADGDHWRVYFHDPYRYDEWVMNCDGQWMKLENNNESR